MATPLNIKARWLDSPVRNGHCLTLLFAVYCLSLNVLKDLLMWHGLESYMWLDYSVYDQLQ